jgi:aspartate/methionine/tyrosine aminotransferase
MSDVQFPPRLSAAALRAFDPERWAGSVASDRTDWVGLHQGDPCFATPAHIVEAAFKAVADEYTHYPPPPGDRALREAIVERMNRVATRPHLVDDVFVTAGATEAIYCALTAYIEPGDEVVLFDPSYSLFAPIIRQIGGTAVFVTMTGDFRIDPELLRAAVTPRTRMIVVNNPVNPTGTVFSREELVVIADVARSVDALVLADEVYDHLVYDGEFVSTLELPELADRLLYVNSFSKTYAMTGWRIGWLAGSTALSFGAQIIHRNCVGTVNWPTQRAALAALTGSQDVVTEMLEGYRVRRDILVNGLGNTPGLAILPTQGTFYAWVGFAAKNGLTSERVAQLLRDEGVGVRSGTEYGAAGEGYLRLSFAASIDDVTTGAERIHNLFSNLSVQAVPATLGER